MKLLRIRLITPGSTSPQVAWGAGRASCIARVPADDGEDATKTLRDAPAGGRSGEEEVTGAVA